MRCLPVALSYHVFKNFYYFLQHLHIILEVGYKAFPLRVGWTVGRLDVPDGPDLSSLILRFSTCLEK